MKNILLAIFSIACIAYTTNAMAQTADATTADDGTILIDDSWPGQQTAIEIKNGGLYINNIKVSDLDDATQLKILKRNNQDAGDVAVTDDLAMRFSVYNKAMLGVAVEDAKPSVKVISVVGGSAADKSGLRTGDFITAINDENVKDYTDLMQIMAQHKVGDKIKIDFYRNKELQNITAQLTENTQMDRLERTPDVYPIPFQGLEEMFDIPVNELMTKAYEVSLSPRLGLDLVENTNGLEVIAIDSSGLAAKAGLQKGDIIKMVKGREVLSLYTFKEELEANSTEEQIAMSVFRGGKITVIPVNVPRIKRSGSF